MAAANIQEALDRAIELGERGIQVAAYLGNEQIVDGWAGIADVESGRPVTRDTIFPVFSVTKVAAAVALHVQAERGLVKYDEPIATYWPEFAANGKATITPGHVLAHQSGIPQMPATITPQLMCDWDWMVQEIEKFEPWFPPGEHNAYQAAIHGWLIGEVVRRTDPKHRPFGHFVREEVFEPLGIHDYWLGLPESELGRVGTLTSDISNEPLENESPISKAAKPEAVAFGPEVHNRHDVWQACLPGTGGIGSASAVVRLFAMLANEGELDGVRLLSKETVRWCLTPRPNGDELDLALWGGDRATAKIGVGGIWLAGTVFGTGPGVLCHTGFGSSLGFADLASKVSVVIAHNRLFSGNGPLGVHPYAEVVKAVRAVATEHGAQMPQ